MKMTDLEMKHEALMHLEYAAQSFSGIPEMKLSDDEVQCRIWAAHYLIQAMQPLAHKPNNFDEVLEEARKYERTAEAAMNSAAVSG